MDSKAAKKYTTLELPLAAFLDARNIEVSIENQNGREVFTALADDKLYRLLNDYNSDALIGITTYISSLKSMKQRLYATKAIRSGISTVAESATFKNRKSS